jgi:intracellular sulfur oxidation DsrE/DsrF family protein
MPTPPRRLALAAAAAALLSPWAVAQTPAPKQKLVVQMSDPDPAKWNLALNNIKNVQDDLGAANTDIVLVTYGPGIGMTRFDAPTAGRITEALKAGVKVLVCENTMTNQRLNKADMHPEVGYVKAGASEIMRRQQQGYAYLRP